MSGWTIYLDLNHNGVPDAADRYTTTNANGVYQFDNVPPGNYRVDEVPQPLWIPRASTRGA